MVPMRSAKFTKTAPLSSQGSPLKELSHRHGTSATLNHARTDHPCQSRLPVHHCSTHSNLYRVLLEPTTVPNPSSTHGCPFHGGVCNTPFRHTHDSRIPWGYESRMLIHESRMADTNWGFKDLSDTHLHFTNTVQGYDGLVAEAMFRLIPPYRCTGLWYVLVHPHVQAYNSFRQPPHPKERRHIKSTSKLNAHNYQTSIFTRLKLA